MVVDFILFLQEELSDVYQRTGEVTRVENRLYKYKWHEMDDFDFDKHFMEFQALALRYEQITKKPYAQYG